MKFFVGAVAIAALFALSAVVGSGGGDTRHRVAHAAADIEVAPVRATAADAAPSHKIVPTRYAIDVARGVPVAFSPTQPATVTRTPGAIGPGLVVATKTPCVGRRHYVKGVGNACPTADGQLRVDLPGGGALLTHGPDPAVYASTGGGGVPTPAPSASVSDIVCATSTETAFKVVYAHPSEVASSYAGRLSMMRDRIYQASAYVDAQALAVDPTRHMRMKFRCSGGLPIIDEVTLASNTATSTFDNVGAQLRNAGYGSTIDNVLVFQDSADPDSPSTAGLGSSSADSSPGDNNNTVRFANMFAVIYWVNYGGAQGYDWDWETTLHEMTHTMGAVQSDAPNYSGNGHCIDGQDVMCYVDGGARQGEYSSTICATADVYDCNHDDYFGPLATGGNYLATHWNIGAPANAFLKFKGVSDTTAPTISLSSPAAGTTVNGTSATFAAADDVSIEKVDVVFDAAAQTPLTYSGTRAPWSFSYASLGDGVHTVVATVTDTSGNTATTGTLSFTVDRTGPATASGLAIGAAPYFPSWIRTGSVPVIGRWTGVSDPSGVTYEWCLTTSTSNCTTSAVPWRGTGISVAGTAVTFSDASIGNQLAEDGVSAYKLCVRTADGLGNRTGFYSCAGLGVKVDNIAMQAPAAVRDGTTGDRGIFQSAASGILGANWDGSPADTAYNGNPGSGLADYELCLATVSDCSSGRLMDWVKQSGFTSGQLNSVTFVDGQAYYACVRTVDAAGNTSGQTCSDGQRPDLAAPTPPVGVTDGLGSDLQFLHTTTAADAHWTASTDANGIASYQWCISTGSSCTGSIARTWNSAGITINGTAVSASATGLVLTQRALYLVCVRAIDNAGRTGPIACSNGATVDSILPTAPSGVVDGASGADAQYQATGASVAAHWNAAFDAGGIASYETCVSTGSLCNATVLQDWTSVGNVLSATATGLSINSETVVFTCVRAIDTAGNPAGPVACSDGVTVDTVSPTAPSNVLDGGSGSDLAVTNSQLGISARWGASDDYTSGVASYEWCISTSADCTSGIVTGWTPVDYDGAGATDAGISLPDLVTIHVCVRAIDVAGNPPGQAGCSNGFAVDATPPPATTAVSDGTAADRTWLRSTTTIDANWPDVDDQGTGVVSWQWCVSSQAPCGGTVLHAYGSSGVTDTGATISGTLTGLDLAQGSQWFVCARAIDGAGNPGTATCSDGQAVDTLSPSVPPPVNDGLSGSDLSAQADGTNFAAHWSAADDGGGSGVASTEWCIATSPDCSSGQLQGWGTTGINGLTGSFVAAQPLANGTSVYACVRASDVAGNGMGAPRCSNGVLVTLDVDPPAAPTALLDGASGADLDVTRDAVGVAVRWTDSVDASPIGRYEWCVTTADDQCAANPLLDWTDVGTATSAADATLAVTDGATWRACVRAYDLAGNGPSGIACSNGVLVDATAPPATASVNDGAGADITWQLQGETIAANWADVSDNATGIAGWEWCVSAVTDCGGTPRIGWTGTGVVDGGATVSASAAGLALTDGTSWFTCVRASDGAGNTGAATCSNGATVDVLAAPAPSDLLDGTTGADLVTSQDRTTAAVRWTAPTDTSGIAGYEWCVAPVPTCAGARIVDWTTTGISGTTASASGLSLANGASWFACVRAFDGAGNGASAEACSNGVAVATPPPGAPSDARDGLTATDAVWLRSTGTVSATWLAPAGGAPAGGYEWCISATTNCGGSPVRGWSAVTPVVAAGRLQATASGLALTQGATYFTCVRSADEIAQHSAPACSNGQRLDTLRPTVPASLRASSLRRNSVVISWAASRDNVRVASYSLWKKVGTRWVLSSRSATLKRTVKGLKPHTRYSFRVTATDTAGNTTAASKVLTITTKR